MKTKTFYLSTSALLYTGSIVAVFYAGAAPCYEGSIMFLLAVCFLFLGVDPK